MSINIHKYTYNDILIIDKKNLSDNNTIYIQFIKILENNKIIELINNKIKFIKDNICIVFNINNDCKEILSFNKLFYDKMKKHNIKLLILNKSNDIYYINNIIICHSSLIKSILTLSNMNEIIIELKNYNINDLMDEIIRNILLNIVKYNKLTINCFTELKDKMNKYCNKTSEHYNKSNSIFYLNKTVIVEDYKNNIKREIKYINNPSIIKISNDNIILY